MRNRLALVVLASAAIAGGCTTAGSSPATTPTIPTTTTPTLPVNITTTTTAPATSTTIDRIAEIQAIFEDLERRRLQAIFDQDEEAFRSVYANDQYLELSLTLMDEIVVLNPALIEVQVVEITSDSSNCIAVRLSVDATDAIDGGSSGTNTYVAEVSPSGWGLSWVGEGWQCDGSHPLSS